MEILTLVIGLGLIFLGIIISDKKTGVGTEGENVVDEQFVRRVLRENEEKLKERASELVAEQVQLEVDKVDDQMAHISNEKIMAVSEFSDQLIEKIEQNHKEVVFLYDMLNAKENEMKEFVQEIDKSKLVLEELANKELEKQKMLQHKRIQKELEKQLRKEQEKERQRIELKKSGVITDDGVNESSLVEPEKKVNTQMTSLEEEVKAIEAKLEEEKHVTSPIEEKDEAVETKSLPTDENQNQVILDLYNEGKSIMEIARVLGKGQGEVKLVIDLFQGAR